MPKDKDGLPGYVDIPGYPMCTLCGGRWEEEEMVAGRCPACADDWDKTMGERLIDGFRIMNGDEE